MRVVGLMSGTSMDGIDAALVEISDDNDARGLDRVRILAYRECEYAETKEADDALRQRVRHVMDPAKSTVVDVCQINMELGYAFGRAVMSLAAAANVALSEIDLVASHGQTVYHIPTADASRGWRTPSTLQVGDPCVIAEMTGIDTVADFRVRDMAAGGVGAPLIPFVDSFLFRDSSRDVILQNIGGIGNCTLLQRDGAVVAFDTGPGNMVMDLLVQRFLSPLRYDKDGERAARGVVNEAVLERMLAMPFFTTPPPRATGHELFGREFVEAFAAAFGDDYPGADARLDSMLATALELTARSIVDAYRNYLFPKCSAPHGKVRTEVIASGGGTRNKRLMQRLTQLEPALDWKTMDEYGISADSKEAVGFAILGYHSARGLPSNVPSVTGASHPVVLGKFAPSGRRRLTFA